MHAIIKYRRHRVGVGKYSFGGITEESPLSGLAYRLEVLLYTIYRLSIRISDPLTPLLTTVS